MNTHWKNFLLSQHSQPFDAKAQQLYSISDWGILTVSGQDAGAFLQGQITCNIHDVNHSQSRLGAFCNPKGRVISTFLLTKLADDFLLLLPSELLETVKTRLQKYILRAKVQLTDRSDSLCLLGLTDTTNSDFLATEQLAADTVRVQWDKRSLLIAPTETAIALWSDYVHQGWQVSDAAAWRYLDILAGIPWLSLATSEQFIPQMLNLDKLGGISLTKGCYTGQEIVARTHYLGKAKRTLFLAECLSAIPEANAAIMDASGQTVGHVVTVEKDKLLVVLPDCDTAQLRLKDYNQAILTLLNAESS